MLKKFLEEECKGYIIQARYDDDRDIIIYRVFKGDVSVDKSIGMSLNSELNEFNAVQTIRAMLREADKKLEEHTANKGKIKKVEKKGENYE